MAGRAIHTDSILTIIGIYEPPLWSCLDVPSVAVFHFLCC